MKIGSELQFEVPDHCPENCPFLEDKKQFSQGCTCSRCPIINCTPFDYEGQMICMIDPEDFRDDWAREWEDFFKTGIEPLLELSRHGT